MVAAGQIRGIKGEAEVEVGASETVEVVVEMEMETMVAFHQSEGLLEDTVHPGAM